MKILLFHPVPLPPKDYGGVERVVLWLAQALRDLGHSVTVAALEGSRLPAGVELLPIPKDERSAEKLAERLPPGIDIVHFHAPPEPGFARLSSVPSITTIHGNGKSGETFDSATVFLSKDHARRHGRETYVYNGINPDEFSARAIGKKKSRFAPLFLSKTTLKTKNLRGAIAIASHAGMKMSIAGGSRPLGLRFWALVHGHRWLGPVAAADKARALTDASALLFPVNWEEPFGLVMIEAMMSGTPVVASRRGSVPELITPDTGRIIDLGPSGVPTAEELGAWEEALREVESLDPVLIREEALRRFSHRRMAESYLEVYKRVIQGETLP